MYSMIPKADHIRHTLPLLTTNKTYDSLVIVFHRENNESMGGLVTSQTIPFKNGRVGVDNYDHVLNDFARFIAGIRPLNSDTRKAPYPRWRKLCREMGKKNENFKTLFFDAPEVMRVFNRHAATALADLVDDIPHPTTSMTTRNPKARQYRVATMFKPTKVEHIQTLVKWATERHLGLVVMGGAHSEQYLWPDAVCVDMSNFNAVHLIKDQTRIESSIIDAETCAKDADTGSSTEMSDIVIAGGGATVGDIVNTTLPAGLMVPLGSRPSVGAGLWLQGGIGHNTRQHGLSCDSIIGAVIITPCSAILCIGKVPEDLWPTGAVRPGPTIERDLFWAIRGAGTNFGIILSVTFKTYPAEKMSVGLREKLLGQQNEAPKRLTDDLDIGSFKEGRNVSKDMFLYQQNGQLKMHTARYDALATEQEVTSLLNRTKTALANLGISLDSFADQRSMFDHDLELFQGLGLHRSGRTSSFKRCVFLKYLNEFIIQKLVDIMANLPTQSSYVHLFEGEGAVRDIAPDTSAFGCRDWDFACVITGIWDCEEDGSALARSVEDWVYKVATDLSHLGCGAYGADLGPDPRDACLAKIPFGPNLRRLVRLKREIDPSNVFRYACPLLRPPPHKLIFIVTGVDCSGKDRCATEWADYVGEAGLEVAARAVSISDKTKREYCQAHGADFERLLKDRAYKDKHRAAIQKFFKQQLNLRSQLAYEHFTEVVEENFNVDILFITGMRDAAPVASFAHLVPESRLIEVRIEVSEDVRERRRGSPNLSSADGAILDWCPCLTFNNDKDGSEEVKRFAEQFLLVYLDKALDSLAETIPKITGFPDPDTDFRDVLKICAQPGGLTLCAKLIENHTLRPKSDLPGMYVAACEAGGFLFASAYCAAFKFPLVVIRKAGKLPPPVVSASKPQSYIESVKAGTSSTSSSDRFELHAGSKFSSESTILIVDDVLSSGRTLCAVIKLLVDAGASLKNIGIMVVAELPLHQGRERLRREGYGLVRVQSLMVFGGK